MVAASRLGNMIKPKWCFSDVLFDMTMAIDNMLSNADDPTEYLTTMKFTTNNTKITQERYGFYFLACENL